MQKLKNWAFEICLFTLPLLYIPGLGSWVREPKTIALLLIAGLSSFLLMESRKQSGPPISFSPSKKSPLFWVPALLSTLLLLQLISYSQVVNTGSFFICVGFTLAALLIGTALAKSEKKFDKVPGVLFWGTLILGFCASFEVFFGFSIFQEELFWGLPLGGRNYLPIFLSLCLPAVGLYVSSHSKNETPTNQKKWKAFFRIGFLSLAFVQLYTLCLIFRARTVWVILAVQLSLLVLFALRKNAATVWRRLLKIHVSAFVAALFVISFVPNHLSWNSENPYLQSLSSMKNMKGSSGRDQLWSFLGQIIQDHPFVGIGSGQYPVRSRTLLTEASLPDLKVFSFLTSDSPAFNDYLQMTAEIGIFGGLIFFALYFLLPIRLLGQAFTKSEVEPVPVLLLMSNLSMGLGAVFTNSFDRPEQLLLWACNWGFILQSQISKAAILPTATPDIWRKLEKPILSLARLTCLVLGLVLLSRFTLLPHPANKALVQHQIQPDIAYRIWPWDKHWNTSATSQFLIQNRTSFSQYSNYIADRAKFWPDAPDSHTVRARAALFDRNIDLALKHYRSSIVEVPGGRCHKPNFEVYRQIAERKNLSLQNELNGSPYQDCLRLLPSE